MKSCCHRDIIVRCASQCFEPSVESMCKYLQCCVPFTSRHHRATCFAMLRNASTRYAFFVCVVLV